MKSVHSLWLLCVCYLAELTVFSGISFGQTLPVSQQLRLLQPNGKERLQSGSEYTIKWTGIDSARPVRLEYSINGGRSWKRITDRALGGSYLWKPIPNEPSDSCLILATGLEADSTESVGRSLVQFPVERVLSNTPNNSLNSWRGQESLTFSPDGTKILAILWSEPLLRGNSFYGWKQLNVQVRDAKTGSVLYNLPPYISDQVFRSSDYTYWWGYGGTTYSQALWNPDNKSLLAQTSDTTYAIYDAQTGLLIRTISFPTQGNKTYIGNVKWTGGGQEILATTIHQFISPANPNGYLDTIRTFMMRLNAATGALINIPFQTGMTVWNSNKCYGDWSGNVSNDGERRLVYNRDTVTCVYKGITIRSTRDNSLLQTINTSAAVYWWSDYGWGGGNYGNGSAWSPNDSLIVLFQQPTPGAQNSTIFFFSTTTGQQVQRIEMPIAYSGIRNFTGIWSADSRKYLIEPYTPLSSVSPTRFVLDIYAGSTQPTLQDILGWSNSFNSSWFSYGFGYSGNGFWGVNAQNISPSHSSTTWSPDGRYIAGFVWRNVTNDPQDPNNFANNISNTVGIWDAKTGCLLQTFRLPFPDDTNSTSKRTFYSNSLQWSPDGKRLLLYSPAIFSQTLPNSTSINTFEPRFDGTALITNVKIEQLSCQEDISDSLWTILPRGTLRVANVSFPVLQCGAASSTLTFPVTNTSLKNLTIALPTITGANASDFSLISLDGVAIPPTTTKISLPANSPTRQLEVRFTPSSFGNRNAQMIFTDTSGIELERITLTGRKDTLAISPTNLRLSFSRVLQNSITSASVSFRNLSTLPLYWDGQMFSQTPPLQTGGQMGGQQFQSAAGSFRVDSIAPGMVAPGDSGRVYVTFLRTDKEGVFSDSSTVLRCGTTTSQLLITAEIIPNTPRLEVDSLLDFGHLICETSSGATLRVRNTGGKVLHIFNVGILNDMFQTSAKKQNIEIQPFDFLDIPFTFTPSVGKVTESAVVLNSDDVRNTRRSVVLRGQKTLFQYEWQPALVDFGNVSFGVSRTKTLTLQNQGTEPYQWNTLPQALTDDFVVERVEPNPIPQGASATVTVRFLGRREMVPVTAKLSLTMNDACKTTTLLNLTARVLEPQPHIVIADTVRVRTLSCGTETRSTITISNTGDADLQIKALSVEGAHTMDFPLDSMRLGSRTLKPMETTTLEILFHARDTGTRTATLLLKTNDTATARNGDIRVALVGRKDSVGFVLSRQPRSLTTVDENTPLYDTLVVRNTGTVPLAWSNAQNPQEVLPFRIDTTFRIERIEPVITQRNDSSRVIVRFSGGTAGLVATPTFRLQASSTLAPSCNRMSELALRGEVKKEPRLAAIADVSSRILCENTTTLTIRLVSTGTDDVLIQNIDFLENPNAIFNSSSLSLPIHIASRTGRDSIVITARTAQTGTFTARVRIRSNAANMPDTTVAVTVRKDSSGLQAIPAILDFAALAENVAAERMITLVNTGTIEQRFVLPVRAGAFTLDSVGTNPLPANSSTQARVRFAGSAGGVVRDTVRLADSCGRVLAVPLQARVVAGVASLPDTVGIQIGNVEDVPLYLRNRQGIEAGMEAAFRLRVANASLLDVVSPMPTDSRFTPISSQRLSVVAQTLTFRTVIAGGAESEPLVRLRVRSLLGSATTTTIVLDSMTVSGVRVQGVDTALYRSLGINYAGGSPRLLYTPNLTAFAIAPNPVGDELTLTMEVVKSAPVTVELTDILGRKQVLHEGMMESGETMLRLSAAQVASGAYLLTVKVGAEQIARMISIIH